MEIIRQHKCNHGYPFLFIFSRLQKAKEQICWGRAQQSDDVVKGEGGFPLFFGLRRMRVDDKH